MASRSGQDGVLDTVDAMAQFAFVIHGALEKRAAEHDVSMIQTRLLGILRDRTSTMNELAVLLNLDKSSVTGLVDRAQRRGLVIRSASATDRRAVLVTLSEAGRALVTHVASQFHSDVSAMLASISTDERDTLTVLVSGVLVAHAARHGIDLFPSPVG